MRIRTLLVAAAVLVAGLSLPATAAQAADTSISGHVTDASTGLGVQTSVFWFDPRTSTAGTAVTTDAAGAYTLTVPASIPSYYLAVNVRDDLRSASLSNYVGTFVGDGFAKSFAYQTLQPLLPLAVGAGDVALQKPGIATMSNGALANATFTLQNLNGDYVSQATASATGTVTFTGLVPGNYRITSGPGLTPLAASFTTADFSVFGNATTTVTPPLSAAAIIAGTVTSSGKPVAGLSVRAFQQKGTAFSEAKTDATGKYVLGSLPTGSYDFYVYDPSTAKTGYVQYHRTIKATSGKQSTQNVSVQRGGALTASVSTKKGTAIQIAVRSGSYISQLDVKATSSIAKASFTQLKPGSYTVYGLTTSGQRYGLTTVKVVAGKVARSHAVRLTRRTLTLKGSVTAGSTGTVDAESRALFTQAHATIVKGHYTLRGLIPGRYDVTTSPKGYYSTTRTVTLSRSTTTRPVSRGSKLAVLKGAIATAFGPLSNSYVQAVRGSDFEYFLADDAGRFSEHLDLGTYTLKLDTSTYAFQQNSPFYYAPSAPIKATLVAGKTTDLGTITLVAKG